MPIQHQGKSPGQQLTEAQALRDLAATPSGNMSELDRMRKGGFDKNRAQLKTAFTENQMYIRNIFGKNLGHKAYDLPPYEQIDRSACPMCPPHAPAKTPSAGTINT